MESKKWYQSKLIWLGIIQTLIGILGLVADFLNASNFTSADFVVLVSGALTVVLRYWFTDTPIK